MTVFALTLRWLTPQQAAALALAAVLLNWVVLPLTGRDLRRPGDPWLDGVKLYPVAVLLLVFFLPLPEAAAAWGVLGVGDVASNVLGRRFGSPPFLGRPDRSLAGTSAFVIFGGAAAVLLLWFVSGYTPDPFDVSMCFSAAAAGALAEFTPKKLRIDDNLPIAIASGAVFLLFPPPWG
jgi:dolichol kinase